MRKRLLILDDDNDIISSIKIMFEVAGLEVDTAGSLNEAEALLKAHDYCIAILDIRKCEPSKGGIRLLQYIKAYRPMTCEIVAMGYGGQESMQSAYILGASFYIEKPASTSEIRATLGRLEICQ